MYGRGEPALNMVFCLALSFHPLNDIQCAACSWITVTQPLLASWAAGEKCKEQMVVFVIPSSFQCPGKPRHLSLSRCITAALQASE